MEEERQDLYEVTVILNGDSLDNIEKVVAEFAQVKKTSDLGIKQFAYPIGKLSSGHYATIEFVAGTDKIREIESHLKALKEVVRFLVTKAIRKGPEIVRTGEYAKKPETEEKAVAESQEIKPAEEVKESKEVKPEIIAEPEVAPIPEPTVEPEIVEAEQVATEPEPEKEVEVKPKPVKEEVKPAKKPAAEKLVTKKPKAKAEKVSADELDKKLEELVKE